MHITPLSIPPSPKYRAELHHHLPKHLYADITPGYGRTAHCSSTRRHEQLLQRCHRPDHHNGQSKENTALESASTSSPPNPTSPTSAYTPHKPHPFLWLIKKVGATVAKG